MYVTSIQTTIKIQARVTKRRTLRECRHGVSVTEVYRGVRGVTTASLDRILTPTPPTDITFTMTIAPNMHDKNQDDRTLRVLLRAAPPAPGRVTRVRRRPKATLRAPRTAHISAYLIYQTVADMTYQAHIYA
jgi:hypothetical protein